MDADAINRPGLFVAHRVVSAILNFTIQYQSTPQTKNINDIEKIIKEAAAKSLLRFTSNDTEDTSEALLKICRDVIKKKANKSILEYLLDIGTEVGTLQLQDRFRFLQGYLEYRLHLGVQRNDGLKKGDSSMSLDSSIGPIENKQNRGFLVRYRQPATIYHTFSEYSTFAMP